MFKIHPVILSGGMGSRLWPISRVSSPKQFQTIDGNGGPSFLQTTVLRHCNDAFHAPLIVANSDQSAMIDSQMSAIGLKPQIIGEPVGRNTGPAVLAAALHLRRRDPDAMLLVLPSDHVIDGDLNGTILEASRGADAGRIVVLGIAPTYAETGFGYMTSGGVVEGYPALHHVSAFVEKPDLQLAQALIREGRSFWATGISIMRADLIIAEFARLEPETLAAVELALANGKEVGTTLHLDRGHFTRARSEPTERMIFEHSPMVAMAPVSVGWNDVGAWSAVHTIGTKDADGNVLSPEVLTVDTHNSLVRGCGRLIAVVGLDDVIIVDTPDALLVTNHQNAQKVKDAVAALKTTARPEVECHLLIAEVGILSGMDRLTVPLGDAATPTGSSTAGTVIIVAAGHAMIKVHGETLTVGAGEPLIVRPGEKVRIVNAGDDVLTLVAVELGEARAVQKYDGLLALDCIDGWRDERVPLDRHFA
ncbi:mannose-1-phosphate guanylyltransferase [Roseicyclus marinus]|uniref:mannose-1-phosphate guanylyltransferase n=1 Tax=Roseicyclus marinus TaxID=2161673 RepID=UPI0024106E05|nr:sugar phosphate nucleotidyltransferase [Roseicyclus marinus]MDG3042779.1 sugar phosphate nucleotidyltransferase [Roseicyclus marinus]